MSQEIEIEFKNILTRAEFEQLSRYFGVRKDDFTLQHNHYFDTPTFMLKSQGCALRIREKNGRQTLTLKQPHTEGLLETHQSLTKKEAEAAKSGNRLPDGEVIRVLQTMGVSVFSLTYLGTLSTERAEIVYENGTIMLDHSFYLGTEDYELEYESTDKNEGEKIFQTLLRDFNIPQRETKNKIRRFFEKK
jgi:uncharacterized protein YjbK